MRPSLVTKALSHGIADLSTRKSIISTVNFTKQGGHLTQPAYEKDRIIPEGFGQTEMGRDLLAQDYLLKQLTASLMYPENELGKKFWKRVREEAKERYGVEDVPVETFNKVWIVPEKASVYVHENTVFVVESRLKVLLEEDYLALANHSKPQGFKKILPETINAIREIIIPELELEVNEGADFAMSVDRAQSAIKVDTAMRGRSLHNVRVVTKGAPAMTTDEAMMTAAEKEKVNRLLADNPERVTDRTEIIRQYSRERLIGAYGEGQIQGLEEEAQELTSTGDDLDVWHLNGDINAGTSNLIDAWVAHAGGINHLNMRWFLIGLGSAEEATKILHNAFHDNENDARGQPITLSDQMQTVYEQMTLVNAASLIDLIVRNNIKAPQRVVVHDHHPAALLKILEQEFPGFFKNYFGNTQFLWFGHSPLTNVEREGSSAKAAWDYLLPYVNRYDATIFHAGLDGVPPVGLAAKKPAYRNTNTIDPLSLINIPLEQSFVAATARRLKLPENVKHWILQNARFDRLKDPVGVIKAAERVLTTHSNAGLLLTGPMVSDDMEAFEEVVRAAREVNRRLRRDAVVVRPILSEIPADTDVQAKFTELGVSWEMALPQFHEQQNTSIAAILQANGYTIDDLDDHARQQLILNALQTLSKVIIMKSLSEGFGLALAGAKYHEKVVIASNTGGLGPQVEHGVNGFLVGVHGQKPDDIVAVEMLRGGIPESIQGAVREGSVTNQQLTVLETAHWLEQILSGTVSPTKQKSMASAARQNIVTPLKIEKPIDRAMGEKGRIDLNPSNVNVEILPAGRQTHGDIIEFDLPSNLDPAMLNRQIDGLYPVIINITPITDIKPLLGLSDEQPHPQVSHRGQREPMTRMVKRSCIVQSVAG